MGPYFLSFIWGIFILFSFIGWGSAINRLLFSKCRVDWGQRAAWGIAFIILVGGLLNLTWNVSRISILILIGTGLMYWLFDLYKTWPSVIDSISNQINNYRKDKVIAFGVFIICSLVILQYSALVYSKFFHDDQVAYLVFAEKMIQTGSLGLDPFSIRRIETSLGGQYFLQSFILSMLSRMNLFIIDPGLGIIISVGLLFGYIKNKEMPGIIALMILVFFLLIPPPRTNTTALVIPLVLFLSLFRTLDWKELGNAHFMANGFIIALLTAAICSLKATLIPACSILFASSYLFYIVKSKKRLKAIYEFFTAAILVGIFLLPWMLSLYQSSGTLLYPILGKGYHGTVYGTFLNSWADLTVFGVIKLLLNYISYPDIVALVLLGFVFIKSIHSELEGQREAFKSLLIGTLLGSLIVFFVTTGRLGERYLFSFLFAAVIITMIKVLATMGWSDKEKFAKSTSLLIVIFVTGMFLGKEWFVTRIQYRDYIKNIKIVLENFPLTPEKEVIQYTRMQQSIPQGETLLTRLESPFLLDFRRNKVLIVDDLGGASLPPGMPFFKGSEALADYLILKSIRYVAYSYASETGYQKKWLKKQLETTKMLPFFRSSAINTIDFQDNLKQLGETRERIYDDSEIFVLDLLSRKN